MQKLEVFGANKLRGQIKISGWKNASLPILAATLLSNKKVYLKNLPRVKDIETMINLLKSLGSKIKFDYKLDEKLIGGLKLQLGSYMIDTSIKNKLKKYEKIMLED